MCSNNIKISKTHGLIDLLQICCSNSTKNRYGLCKDGLNPSYLRLGQNIWDWDYIGLESYVIVLELKRLLFVCKP